MDYLAQMALGRDKKASLLQSDSLDTGGPPGSDRELQSLNLNLSGSDSDAA